MALRPPPACAPPPPVRAGVEVRDRRLAVKHAVEWLIAAMLVIALALLLLVIAVAVRAGSPGSALYRQRRVGRDGREFELLKFRTMVRLGDDEGEADAAWALRECGVELPGVEPAATRLTGLGRFLRHCCLDELPQLINVLRGEMSLVGPRPERASYVRVFDESIDGYRNRHRVKPGITGWAQVRGLRGETSLTDRVKADNWYIDNWSFGLDLKILLRTPIALFRR